MGCRGYVTSLKGQTVAFTGAVHIDGVHLNRAQCRARIKELGAEPAYRGVTLATSLLVRADPAGRYLADRAGGRSNAVLDGERLDRENWHHVHVVDEAGFAALLRGRRAPCIAHGDGTRGQAPPVVPDQSSRPGSDSGLFGGEVVPRRTPVHGDLAVDLTGLDAGTAAHEQTVRALIKHLAAYGITLRGPSAGAPSIDGGWVEHGVRYIAEVKSLSGANPSQQLRLGLGQVLDYHDQLGAPDDVVPVLVLEQRPPDSARWVKLGRRHGVTVTWAPSFPGI